METDIISLYEKIKLRECKYTNCNEEIIKLNQIIDDYNNKQNKRNSYWTNEYTLIKSDNNLDLIKKEIFSYYIFDGKDLIEKRRF